MRDYFNYFNYFNKKYARISLSFVVERWKHPHFWMFLIDGLWCVNPLFREFDIPVQMYGRLKIFDSHAVRIGFFLNIEFTKLPFLPRFPCSKNMRFCRNGGMAMGEGQQAGVLASLPLRSIIYIIKWLSAYTRQHPEGVASSQPMASPWVYGVGRFALKGQKH